MNEETYRKLLEIRRSWYYNVQKVYCTELGALVSFNSQGFRHLTHDSRGRLRPFGDRVRRLNLVPRAPSVITHGRIEETRSSSKLVLISIVGRGSDSKIRVVIKKIKSGRLIYFSIV